MSKLYAVYTIVEEGERFLGQSYLTKEDFKLIEQSMEGEFLSDQFITLTDGEVINIQTISSIEEIEEDEDK